MQTPIQISATDWTELQRVLREHLWPMEVWAFGSRARHTAKPYSDLDLAVASPTPFTLAQLAAIKFAFEASDMSIRVDVVDWATCSPSFQRIIEADKVILQSASATSRQQSSP